MKSRYSDIVALELNIFLFKELLQLKIKRCLKTQILQDSQKPRRVLTLKLKSNSLLCVYTN